MALKKLPGGVIVETDGGARLNEEAGINLEAIHRQLAGQSAATADALKTKADVTALNATRAEALDAKAVASEARSVASTAQSTAGTAKSTADNANVRVTALESAAGFGPSTPTDGTMASYLSQPGTLTGDWVTRNLVPRRDTSTYHLYVAPSGSDANDGRDVSRPLATVQAAFNVVAASGPVAQGQWYINLAAGTYKVGNAQQVLTARSVNPVIVRGPDVGGHPNVPTAILDGAGGATYRHGIRAMGDGVNLEVRDIKFVGFTTGANDITRSAMTGEHGAEIRAVNCHAVGSSWAGFYAFNANRAIVNGGIYDGNRYNINANDSQASVTGGTIIRNAKEFGAAWTSGAHGHLDDAMIEDNPVGLYVNGNARVGTGGNTLRRNNVGIRTEDGGAFTNSGAPNVLGAGADSNKWRDYEYGAFSGSSAELKNSASTLRSSVDRKTNVVTGPTTATLLTDLGEIPPSRLWGAGKEATVQVDGTVAATAVGAFVEVYFGGLRVPLSFYNAPSGAWRLTVSLYEVTGGFRAFGQLVSNGEPTRTVSVASAFDPKVANKVTVYGTTKTDACRITMYRASLSITG